MSYLQRIQECNRWEPANFIPFSVEAERVGWVRPAFTAHLRQWPELFLSSDQALELVTRGEDFELQSQRLDQVIRALVEQGVISHLTGEPYPLTGQGPAEAILRIDRGAAAYFGLATFGQHLNGFVKRGNESLMWVGRRASDRLHYPSKLDNMVAGGLPYGVELKDNLAKECWEEGGITRGLAEQAVPVGMVNYRLETRRGLKQDTLFCYDLELPDGFVPRCTDGEVEEFFLWPLSRVARIVSETDEFKPNCNLVIIDFLIRHGVLRPEHSDYIKINAGLRKVFG